MGVRMGTGRWKVPGEQRMFVVARVGDAARIHPARARTPATVDKEWRTRSRRRAVPTHTCWRSVLPPVSDLTSLLTPSTAVVTNPEDPKFDLEKYIASFDK